MKFLIIFVLSCIIGKTKSQGISKCLDFRPLEGENLDKVLMGRWNLVKIYGVPPGTENKISCFCSIGSATGDQNKVLLQSLIMQTSGEVTNITDVATVLRPGVMDLSTDQEMNVMGSKMKVHIHLVHTFMLFENDMTMIGSCYDHPMKKGEYFQTIGVLSRTTTITSQPFLEKAEEIIGLYGMPKNGALITHNNCPY